MKKIILLLILMSLIMTGCQKISNEEDCCPCKDCPECDMCCPCD